MSILTAVLSVISLAVFITILAAIAFYLGFVSLMLFCAAFWFAMTTIAIGLVFACATMLDRAYARLRELRQDPMAEPHGDAPKTPGR